VNANLSPDGSCPLFALLPFTSSDNDDDAKTTTVWSADQGQYAIRMAIGLAAAALMGMDDFNTPTWRNQHLTNTSSCPVWFPEPRFVDSGTDADDGGMSVRAVWNASFTTTPTSSSSSTPMCAILAPLFETANLDLRPALDALEIPMISFYPELDALGEYGSPGTVSVSGSSAWRAQAMLQFLKPRQFLAIWQSHNSGSGGTASTNTEDWNGGGEDSSSGLSSSSSSSSSSQQQAMKLARALANSTWTTQSGMEVSIFGPPPREFQESDESYRQRTLQQVAHMAASGITTIYLGGITSRPELVEMAQMLQSLNMLNDEYIYILPSTMVVPDTDHLQALYDDDSASNPLPDALDRLLTGALVFDDKQYHPPSSSSSSSNSTSSSSFLQKWQTQMNTPAFIERLLRTLPSDISTYLYTLDPFVELGNMAPVRASAYMYDAVIAIGMGACEYVQSPELQDNSDADAAAADLPPDGFVPPPGYEFEPHVITESPTQAPSIFVWGNDNNDPQEDNPSILTSTNNNDATSGTTTTTSQYPMIRGLLGGILRSDFMGMSGRVRFGDSADHLLLQQKKGAGADATQGEYFPKLRDSSDLTMNLYNIRREEGASSSSFTSVRIAEYVNGTWYEIPNTQWVYRNGGTKAPTVLRRFSDTNYLSTTVRAFGLLLMGIAWLLALLFLVLLSWLKRDPIVQRAQPAFMQLLCVGSFFTSASIFTISWDEGAGWTDQQLDVACTLTPWFFFTGHIVMFCALFTKLWRLDRVLQFRKRSAVTARRACVPLLFFLFVTISILIVQTALDPWTWERTTISEIPAESYGKCTNQRFWAYFGPLIGILFTAELLTMVFAWKTADVPEDFRDSGAVMYACFAHLQAWAVGAPVLGVLGYASADATYFGRVFLVWVFAVSGVVVVVGPKVVKALRVRLNPQLVKPQGRRVSVTGFAHPELTSTVEFSGHGLMGSPMRRSSYGSPMRRPRVTLGSLSNHSYSKNNSSHGCASNTDSVTSKPQPNGGLRWPPAPPAASAHPMRLVRGPGGQMIEIPKILDPSLNEEDEEGDDEEEIQQLEEVEDDDDSSDQDIKGIREFVASASTRNLQVVPLSDHHPPPLRKTFSWVASASFRIRNNANKNTNNDNLHPHPLQIPELCSSSSSASSACSSNHSSTSHNSMVLSSSSILTSNNASSAVVSLPSSIASSIASTEDHDLFSMIDDDQHHSDEKSMDHDQNNE
jgi:hypothetical protein